MLAHLRSNIVAYLALFVALSGTAVAATALPRNSVGPKQLKRAGVTGKDVKRNTLTGRHIRERRLAQVPSAASAANAAALGGQPPSAYLAAGAKAADADRLDGIDSSVFGTVETVAGMNFEPRASGATEKVYEGTGSISCTGSTEDYTYRIQLPQGASVTALDYRFVDNEAGSNSGLELRAYDTFEGTGMSTVLVASTSSTGASGTERTVTAPPAGAHAIDNSRYSYQLNWSPFHCGATMQIAGAAVHYSLP